MTRIAILISLTLALGACASGVGDGRSGGVATYDDLKAAQQKCAATGGTMKLQKNGDAHYLGDYACEKK